MSEDRKPDDLIGKQIGQYEIIEEIGRGGMATVYRARQKSMNRTVAIKVLPRHLLHDPGFFDRFEREVDVIAHLEHPHILPTYDYGQSDNVPYIVMRFLGGGSLERMIKQGPVDPKTLEKPLRQIAQALDYAHQQGVIHRDIKPGNIMLDEAGNAYLSDFGIARVLGSEMTGSMIVGTPAYMSPEQANGFPIDGRADIYALGVVLFELLTGEEPHQAETPMAVLLKHINEPIPPLSNYRDDIPDPLEDVIFKATAKQPEDRYASASDMARAYVEALSGEAVVYETPTRAKTPPPAVATRASAGTAPLDISPDTGLPRQTQPPAQAQRSNRLMYVGGFVVLLIIGGIIAGLALSNQPKNEVIATIAPLPTSTPFPGSDEMAQSDYRIVVLREWVRPPSGYIQHNLNGDNVAFAHRWRDGDDRNAYVELQMINVEMADADAFRQAIIDYENQYLAPEGIYTYLTENIAPNGTVVRSFEVVGATQPDVLSPGQVDFIYMNYNDALVIFIAYSSYESGNQELAAFNAMYQSLVMTGRQLADPRVIGEVSSIGEPEWSIRQQPEAVIPEPQDTSTLDESAVVDEGEFVTIEETVYTITVPREFTLSGAVPYNDISDGNQVAHVYQIYPETFAIVVYAPQVDTSTEEALNDAIEVHINGYYSRDDLTLTSNFTDEQGRIFRVYDFAGNDNFTPGTITLVYFPNTPFLTMMELFTTDASAETYTETLDAILESFEIRAG